jgi:hypothetical protein
MSRIFYETGTTIIIANLLTIGSVVLVGEFFPETKYYFNDARKTADHELDTLGKVSQYVRRLNNETKDVTIAEQCFIIGSLSQIAKRHNFLKYGIYHSLESLKDSWPKEDYDYQNYDALTRELQRKHFTDIKKELKFCIHKNIYDNCRYCAFRGELRDLT